MEYQVNLEIFEGPLDLLYYLIKKKDLDIYDIPIAEITKDYLRYLILLKTLNLDKAGEFLVMATTLMEIKVKMLFPPLDEEKEEVTDPRTELVTRLLEYQKFKQVAELLETKYQKQKDIYSRQNCLVSEEDYIVEVSLYDLFFAFKKLFKEVKKEVKEIIEEEISLEDKITEITAKLKEKKYLWFNELFSLNSRRIVLIVTFLALLELIKLRRVVARQEKLFEEIRIYRFNG